MAAVSLSRPCSLALATRSLTDQSASIGKGRWELAPPAACTAIETTPQALLTALFLVAGLHDHHEGRLGPGLVQMDLRPGDPAVTELVHRVLDVSA